MASRFLKTVAAIAILITGFLVYEWFWGDAYGGIKYQRKSVQNGATVLLEMYFREQKEAKLDIGKYRHEISKREPYSTVKKFRVGFIEDHDRIRALCPDCKFSESEFKIGALYVGQEGEALWTIDQDGRIENPKSLP